MPTMLCILVPVALRFFKETMEQFVSPVASVTPWHGRGSSEIAVGDESAIWRWTENGDGEIVVAHR